VALALGEALDKVGVRVMVVDTDRNGLHMARMRGLSTFYGNPISEYTERYLEMTPYNQLLAVSRSHDSNMVVCYQFRHQFDKRSIYTIRTGGIDSATDEGEVVPELRFNPLFQENTTWSKLASLLSRGAEIRSTPLTDQYGLNEYRERMGSGTLPLFALDEEGRLHWVSGNQLPDPGPGWTLASLLPPEQVEALNRERHRPDNAK
jgi:hypothetical protein